jgi:hypothetical protein
MSRSHEQIPRLGSPLIGFVSRAVESRPIARRTIDIILRFANRRTLGIFVVGSNTCRNYAGGWPSRRVPRVINGAVVASHGAWPDSNDQIRRLLTVCCRRVVEDDVT